MRTLTHNHNSLPNQCDARIFIYFYPFFLFSGKYLKKSLIFILTALFSYCTYAQEELWQLPPDNNRVYNQPVYINELSNQSYNFDSTIFKQEVSINEVNSNELSFNWAIFFAPLRIYHLNINENGSFYYTTFYNKVELSKVWCHSRCIFYGNIFNEVTIANSSFKDLLSFRNSLFNKEIKIENSSFADTTDFSHITAKDNIRFNNNFFSKKLLLNDSIIYGNISFNDTVPPPYIDLSNMQLKQYIDLNGMDLSNQHYAIRLNLLKTDVHKIKFNYINFKLYFPSDTSIDLIQNIYFSLLKKFKNEDDITSYNLLLAEYKEYMNIYHKDYIKNLISRYWWNHSTNPEWIFFWMSMIIFFYTIINAIFYEKLTNYYVEIPFLKDTGPASIRPHPFIHFIYNLPRAFLFTIVLFCGGQFNLRVSINTFRTNHVLINIYFIIIIFSGLICLYFLLKYILAQLG